MSFETTVQKLMGRQFENFIWRKIVIIAINTQTTNLKGKSCKIFFHLLTYSILFNTVAKISPVVNLFNRLSSSYGLENWLGT